MTEGCYRGGESFEGSTPARTASRNPRTTRVERGGIFGFQEARNAGGPHGWLQGATNLQAAKGHGSSDRCPAAEKTIGAGRNGRDGTSSGRGSLGPKDERRLIWEWTQWQLCRRRGSIDEPHERSPTTGSGLRTAISGRDRANRCVSLKRRHAEVSTITGALGKRCQRPNEPSLPGCW